MSGSIEHFKARHVSLHRGLDLKARARAPIDVDKIRIRKDHYFPNAYIIDLPLDFMPDHVWQDMFEREWKSSRHLWDRKLFVIGKQIRLVTPPNNIKEKLDWVKEVIEKTNKYVDDYNREVEARAVQIAQLEEKLTKQILEEEKANIEMIRDILRKRFRAL